MRQFADIEAQNDPAWYMLRVDHRRPSACASSSRRVERSVARPSPTRAPIGGLPDITAPRRAEFLVADLLERRGIETLVPCESYYIRANRYHRKVKQLVARPILTGYVLAHLPARVNWLALMSVPMVRGVMGFGGVPARLPVSAVERLMQIARAEQAVACQRLMPTHRAFCVGDRVEVLDGPMIGQQVEVTEITGETAKIFVRLFGADHEANIGLEKIGALV